MKGAMPPPPLLLLPRSAKLEPCTGRMLVLKRGSVSHSASAGLTSGQLLDDAEQYFKQSCGSSTWPVEDAVGCG